MTDTATEAQPKPEITLEDVQSFGGSEIILHYVNDSGDLEELTGKIEKATIAGIAMRVKGGKGIELLMLDRIEEIAEAPVKPKSVLQKKIQPIPEGSMRQHLADRHGISLKWCKNATEKEAADFHDTIDHADLGHKHEAKKESPTSAPRDEREDALAGTPAPVEDGSVPY